MDTDNDEITSIKYTVGIVFSSISIFFISALYIIYLIKPYSSGNAFFRMVIHMEFPNAIYAITGFITYPEDLGSAFCTISGAVRQFCLILTNVWTLIIAYHIKTSISDHEIRPFSLKYLAISYGIATPFAIIPIFLDLYTLTPMYCGLSYTMLGANIAFQNLPILVVLVGTSYYYLSVILYLTRHVSKEAAREFYALFGYPVLVIAYNIGNLASFILASYGSGVTIPLDILAVFWTGILQAQGMLDVSVYSMNYAIREEIKVKLCQSRKKQIGADYDVTFESKRSTLDNNRQAVCESLSNPEGDQFNLKTFNSQGSFEIESGKSNP